jgi:hypothetical protein
MERTIEAAPVALVSEILRFEPRAHPAEGLAMFAKGSRVFLKRPEGLQVVDVNDLQVVHG